MSSYLLDEKKNDFRIVLIQFGIATTTIIFLNNRFMEIQECDSIVI